MSLSVFVIDTNVVVAGLLTRQGASPTARLLDAMLAGRLIYLLSPELLAEYRAVLLRPKIASRHGLAEDQLDPLLTELVANAIWREPERDRTAPTPDPNDQHLWDLLATEARVRLVTGDAQLLVAADAHGRVLSPSQCWALLETQALKSS